MRVYELLMEMNFGEMTYGPWTIKYSEKPMAGGEYRAAGHLIRKKQTEQSIQATGKTKEEAIQNVKDQIDQAASIQRDERKQKIKSADVTKAAIDFNTSVTQVIFNNHEPTAVRFIEEGGINYADIAIPEAIENYSVDLKKLRFVKMHDRRMNKGSTSTKGYGAGITPNQVEQLGLEFNGRYTLDEVNSDEPGLYRRFKMLFDSHVQHKGDAFQLGVPGLTIATWLVKKSVEEYTDDNVVDMTSRLRTKKRMIHNPDRDPPLAKDGQPFDSFKVEPDSSKTFANIIGIKPDGTKEIVSTNTLEIAHGLAGAYNAGGPSRQIRNLVPRKGRMK